MADERPDLEERAGLALDDSTHGSIPSLNALDGPTLERLEQLSRSEQHVVLRHLLPHDSHASIDAFMDDVAVGADPDTWGRGGVLVPSLGFHRLVASTTSDLLARVEPHGPWVALVPDRRMWQDADPSAGAPGVALGRGIGYRWTAPEDTIRILGPVPVSESADPRLAALRWIASRIARVTGANESAEQVVRREVADPSADAVLAARIVDRERAELGTDGGVPGFLAPSEWFTSGS